jgi:hypothetical protein
VSKLLGYLWDIWEVVLVSLEEQSIYEGNICEDACLGDSHPLIRISRQIKKHLSRSMFAISISFHLALVVIIYVVRNLLSQTINHGKSQTTFVSHQADSRLLDNARKNLEIIELQLKTIRLDNLMFFNWFSEYILRVKMLPFRICFELVEGRHRWIKLCVGIYNTIKFLIC